MKWRCLLTYLMTLWVWVCWLLFSTPAVDCGAVAKRGDALDEQTTTKTTVTEDAHALASEGELLQAAKWSAQGLGP